jgi:hypothetical protein
LYIALNQFANYSNFTAAFDEYRIVQAEIWFVMTASASNGAMSASAVDLDSAAAPSSLQGLIAKPGSCVSLIASGQGHYHRFTPRVAVATYSGAFTSYSEAAPLAWIDCASSSVQHYGAKFALDTDSAAHTCDIIVRAIVEFRGIP